jgi:DNA-binding response OmpR family regulator
MTKVLVVEDDPGILRTVADNLKFEKYDILTAMDGETAGWSCAESCGLGETRFRS